MKLAESLYTKGYISYPRTETNIFPKDFHLAQLVEHHINDQNWGGNYLLILITTNFFIVFCLNKKNSLVEYFKTE